MSSTLTMILFGVVVAWIAFALYHAFLSRRLLAVDVQGGKVTRASGKVPPDFYSEVVDILQRAKTTGRVEVRLSEGRAVVITKGDVDANVAQRLRNVVGRFPLQKLRSGRPIRHRG